MGVGWAPNRAGIVRPPPKKADLEGSRRKAMSESVYKVIELVGTSPKSWNEAAKAAVERAAETLRDLRVAEVVAQDVVITDGKVEAYRVKVKVSFKYEGHH
jgi:dodecin